MKRSGVREWALRITLLAGSVLVLLVLLEVGTRVFSDIGPSLKYSRPEIGDYYWPGYAGEVFVAEAGRKVPVRFHADGFRGPDRPRRKPAGIRRLALLGDSFVVAMGVDEIDTAAAQLELLLRESHQAEAWEVLNFGISGASTGTELALWRGLVKTYQPDVVLVAFYVGNDLTDNSSELDTKPRIYFELDGQGRLVQRGAVEVRKAGTNILNRYSRFYVWQKQAVRVATAAALGKLEQATPGVYVPPGLYTYCPQPPEKIERAWALTGALLERFREEVEAEGSRFAVVLIPEAQQVYDDLFSQFQAQVGETCRLDASCPDRRIAAICRGHDIPLLTLREAFRAAAPSHTSLEQDQWLFFGAAGHFNERGNRLAAEQMHRFLADQGWLGRGADR